MAKKVTLVKSLIGRLPGHVGTVNSLGLRKINDSNTLEATPDIIGKIKQVGYLLQVEEA